MKITISKQLEAFVDQLDIPLEKILRSIGVRSSYDRRINLTQKEYYRLELLLSRHLSDLQIVKLSDISQMDHFIPLYFAALSAVNGLAGVKRMNQYKGTLGPVRVKVIDQGTIIDFQVRYGSISAPLPRFALLNEQLIITSLLRTGTGTNITPIRLTGPCQYSTVLANYFGITGEKMPANHLVFKRCDVEKPFTTNNNLMWEYLKPQLTAQLHTANQQVTVVELVQ